MRKLRIIAAIFICKLTRLALRVAGRGGTALPGLLAVKICPDILKYLAKDVRCIAVTGTNGKTTSARMLEQFFIDSGAGCITNKSGSNLLRGIAAEFALDATATGKPKRKHAVIECDEAASKQVFAHLDPQALLVTNVFSDQTDRFTDVGVTLENIKTAVKNAPNAVVCLNADDSLTSSIALDVPNKVVFYGVDKEIYENRADEKSDAPRCIRCGTDYDYAYITYGHLGGFRCPACGYARKSPDIAVTEILAQDADSQTIRVNAFGDEFDVTINIPGAYNIYNAAGAIASAMATGFSKEAVKTAMRGFERGFGRMEKMVINGIPLRMILVKNAAGCNQALNYLGSLTGDALFAICLNDHIADGTDISWIRDANFEKLPDMNVDLQGVFVSGTRAQDIAQRLEAAGVPAGLLRVFTAPGDLLSAALEQIAPVYIMPTYTAMLELRGIISRKYGLKDYWE